MSSNVDERVQKLCREIPEEKDPEKMMRMVEQLNRLLDEKEAGKSNLHDAAILVRNVEAEAHVAQDLPAGQADSGSRKSA